MLPVRVGEKRISLEIRSGPTSRKGSSSSLAAIRFFKELSVIENFKIIKYLHKHEDFDSRLEIVFKIFPRMKERIAQIARTLSGGKQQMLAIAIGLLMNPKLLILDEPSLGSAPLWVANIMETIKSINRRPASKL